MEWRLIREKECAMGEHCSSAVLTELLHGRVATMSTALRCIDDKVVAISVKWNGLQQWLINEEEELLMI